MEEELRARIEWLTQERERFMAEANHRVSSMSGGIVELERLLATMKQEAAPEVAVEEPVAEGVD